MASPLLPLEVIEHVVDLCACVYPSLYNHTLTCRALLPRAHHHLFRSVKIVDTIALHALGDLLDLKQHLRPLISIVTFHEGFGETESRNLWSVVPAALLARLPRPRQWIVKSRKRDAYEEHPWISFRLISLASLRSCSRNIQVLELHAVSFATCSELALYVSAFPTVRTLSCDNVKVNKKDTANYTLRLTDRLRLESLSIKGDVTGPLTLLQLGSVRCNLEHLSLGADLFPTLDWRQLGMTASSLSRLRSLSFAIPTTMNGEPVVQPGVERICTALNALHCTTLRRLAITLSYTQLADLVGDQYSCGILEVRLVNAGLEPLLISVLDARANKTSECSVAITKLFPVLSDSGLLTIEFPSPRLAGHDTTVSALALSSNSKWLATGSEDGSIIVWDAPENSIVREWDVGTPITFLIFSPDGERVASPRTSTTGHEIAIWDVQRGDLLALLSGHTAPIIACVWSPDHVKLASVSREGSEDTIRVWSAERSVQAYLLRDPFRMPSCSYVQFSPDGRWLHAASPDPRATVCWVWYADTGETYRVMGHKHLVTTATFDPTSKLLATASEEGCIFLWKVKTMEWMEIMLSELQMHPCTRLATAAFSQDGMQVFLAWVVLSTVMVQVWDPIGGDRMMSLEGHRASVLSLCFSPDATYIASGSNDKTVRLWRLSDGSCTSTFAEHDSGVEHVAFSPDGERLCSGAWDGSVVIRRLRHLVARRNA